MEGKGLRRGYTTGACAAAAAYAATILLLTGQTPENVTVSLGGDEQFTATPMHSSAGAAGATCAVQKDAGDDPDVTDGMLIYATVRRIAAGIVIAGGEGIGRVTKPGLEQPVGNPAINNGPRRMITAAVEAAMAHCGYARGLAITIAIPGGEEVAKRTFNERLGIVGGLSVLGTTGIEEPMSEAALLATIRAEMSVLAAAGSSKLLLTPGNYGADYCSDTLGLRLDEHIKCGNFIADSIEAAGEYGFTGILLVGHMGKMAKLALGARNTHSRYGDGRIEALLAAAVSAKAPLSLLQELQGEVSADAALMLLQEHGLLPAAMAALGKRIGAQLCRWAGAGTQVEFICFSQVLGLLCKSENAMLLAERWR